ncbi:hypothetical protein HK097_001041 [Rhizophlyctis rosea]|uniref:Uncharacterized protein n=1 Tax=Rhizophlyctis rosea TaxID=64517 RepID=A0AAD5X6E5_9FUNG|nr:hypothetical protein HK097_001041 [Rhizophlyctis rosea]
MLQGVWSESGRKEVEVEVTDRNVKGESVTAVLARLYGKSQIPFTPTLAPSHLATALYFQDDFFATQSTNYILRTLSYETVLAYFLFSDSSYYGNHSEKILNACVEMLCREGSKGGRKGIEIFARLPWKWCERILGSDCFWCDGEVERVTFIGQVLEARLGIATAIEEQHPGLSTELDRGGKRSGGDEREVLNDNDGIQTEGETESEDEDCLVTLLEHTFNMASFSDIPIPPLHGNASEQFSRLLSYGPVYTHMSYGDIHDLKNQFSDLYFDAGIRPDPLLLKEAFWNAQDLQHRIRTSQESGTHLQLDAEDIQYFHSNVSAQCEVTEAESEEEDICESETGSQDEMESEDNTPNLPYPQHLNLQLPTPPSTPPRLRHTPTSNLLSIPQFDTEKIDTHTILPLLKSPYPHLHTRYPPFRCGITFPKVPAVLHTEKLLSKPFTYAGSTWQVYIQHDGFDAKFPRHHATVPTKLGIYLQRIENTEELKPEYEDKREKPHIYFTLHLYFPKNTYLLQSKPDEFKLRQSWGWRSHKMFADAFDEEDVDSVREEMRRFGGRCRVARTADILEDGKVGETSENGRKWLRVVVVMGVV